MLNKNDLALLERLQADFPLRPRPYAQIAASIGLSEAYLIRKLKRLKKQKVIRYVGAIFDNRKLGIKSTLVALAVSKRSLRRVAGLINGYPQVSHNYLREGKFNLWFTLAAADINELKRLLEEIKKKIRINKLLDLRTIKVFKINARFDLKTGNNSVCLGKDVGKSAHNIKADISAVDRKLIAELNKPMGITVRPFLSLSRKTGLSEKRVLSFLARYKRTGWLRRMGVILDHRNVGFKINALAVWKVPESRIIDVTRIFKMLPEITHCYQRCVFPDWPYNIYTMLHARDKSSCLALIKSISIRAGIKKYNILFTQEELKKEKTDLERIFNLC